METQEDDHFSLTNTQKEVIQTLLPSGFSLLNNE